MRSALVCSIPFLLLATVAHAQSAASAVQTFGLIGTWAVDCNETPSPTNEHAVFSVASGDTIELQNDFGRDYDDMVYRIVDASRLAADKLAMRQVLATDNRVVLDVVLMKSNDRVRVWSSRASDGTALVKDGTVALTSGQETRWVTRCNERFAGSLGASPSGSSSDPQDEAAGDPRPD
ncbi:MAG: hypothetical protein QOI12_750 [Alphaproteobacteria bacterium]|nr:hypothetical protein [Alphaproteobacteria bacterium]